MHKELVDYVQKSRLSGQTDEEIYRSLLQSGWRESDLVGLFALTNAPVQQATKKLKTEFMGAGCIVQGAGLLVLGLAHSLGGMQLAVFGLAAMITLFLIGSRMAVKWICTNCNNPLPSKAVKICAVCNAQLR